MIARLGDLLRPALAAAGLEATSELWRIGDAWSRAVGEAIAAQATPVAFRRGELTIAAPIAVWRQELTYLGPDIKTKLNCALGEALVERVRVVAGPAWASAAPAPARRGATHAAPADDATAAPPGPDPSWLDPALPAPLRTAFARLDRARTARLAARPDPVASGRGRHA